MAKVRQDAWSHEDDLLLAETVLRHIREGGTQLQAFEEVGDALNRTSAACGFRWNAEVRMAYTDAIELAKKQRKEKKRQQAKQQASFTKSGSGNEVEDQSGKMQKEQNSQPADDGDESSSESSPTEPNNAVPQRSGKGTYATSLDDVIQYLQQINNDFFKQKQGLRTIDDIDKENSMLKSEIEKLEKELEETKQQLEQIQEDYQVFMQIMDRARKMTVMEDQGNLKSPSFRMDKNGNLEQIPESSTS